tara:strand:- start:2497 stop:4518 length:2022 start_codon:yes stop_codon:yes gene_type:complete
MGQFTQNLINKLKEWKKNNKKVKNAPIDKDGNTKGLFNFKLDGNDYKNIPLITPLKNNKIRFHKKGVRAQQGLQKIMNKLEKGESITKKQKEKILSYLSKVNNLLDENNKIKPIVEGEKVEEKEKVVEKVEEKKDEKDYKILHPKIKPPTSKMMEQDYLKTKMSNPKIEGNLQHLKEKPKSSPKAVNFEERIQMKISRKKDTIPDKIIYPEFNELLNKKGEGGGIDISVNINKMLNNTFYEKITDKGRFIYDSKNSLKFLNEGLKTNVKLKINEMDNLLINKIQSAELRIYHQIFKKRQPPIMMAEKYEPPQQKQQTPPKDVAQDKMIIELQKQITQLQLQLSRDRGQQNPNKMGFVIPATEENMKRFSQKLEQHEEILNRNLRRARIEKSRAEEVMNAESVINQIKQQRDRIPTTAEKINVMNRLENLLNEIETSRKSRTKTQNTRKNKIEEVLENPKTTDRRKERLNEMLKETLTDLGNIPKILEGQRKELNKILEQLEKMTGIKPQPKEKEEQKQSTHTPTREDIFKIVNQFSSMNNLPPNIRGNVNLLNRLKITMTPIENIKSSYNILLEYLQKLEGKEKGEMGDQEEAVDTYDLKVRTRPNDIRGFDINLALEQKPDDIYFGYDLRKEKDVFKKGVNLKHKNNTDYFSNRGLVLRTKFNKVNNKTTLL